MDAIGGITVTSSGINSIALSSSLSEDNRRYYLKQAAGGVIHCPTIIGTQHVRWCKRKCRHVRPDLRLVGRNWLLSVWLGLVLVPRTCGGTRPMLRGGHGSGLPENSPTQAPPLDNRRNAQGCTDRIFTDLRIH